MKKIIISIILNLTFLMLSTLSTYAAQCFTAGKITVSAQTEIGAQTFTGSITSSGNITLNSQTGVLTGQADSFGHFNADNYYTKVSGNINMTNCDNYKDPVSQAGQLSDSVTSQVDQMKQNQKDLDNYKQSANYLKASMLDNYYKQVCPYPTQPESQTSIQPTESAEDMIWTIKKYNDGNYAIFSISSGAYIGLGTEQLFKDYKMWGEDLDSINLIAMGKHPQQTAWNGSSLMRQIKEDQDLRTIKIKSHRESVYKSLSDKNNCPEKLKICPLNSEVDKNNNCSCVKGYGAGAGKSLGMCVTLRQAWEDSGLFLYGDKNSHSTQYGHECNEGYLPNSTKSKCLPTSQNLKGNTPALQEVVYSKKVPSTSTKSYKEFTSPSQKKLDISTSTSQTIKEEKINLKQKAKNFLVKLFNLR